MNEIVLNGCRPTPLTGYLKALGVLRLVAEQKDLKVRGCWKDDRFTLYTCLDRDALMKFLLEEYEPTPVVSPWNGGSGFYNTDNKSGIDAIAASTLSRFSLYRRVIEEIRSWPELSLKAQKETKLQIQTGCRKHLPDGTVLWLDAAFALQADGTPAYNPLLGTGGNDGRLEFSNIFMQSLATLLLPTTDQTAHLLSGALFSEPCDGLVELSIGQFDPGHAGGFNQGIGVETKAFKVNQWDFVLMIEGALCLSASIYRRSQAGARGTASIPFTVHLSPVGFDSDAAGEMGRAETWLPLWLRPASCAELKTLIGEGRATINRRSARNGTDFARAIGSLGVDRGINEFTRFTFLVRRGMSYVALPSGRLPVRYRPSVRLLDELDPILDKLGGFISQFKNPPATLSAALHKIEEALYACSVNPEPSRFAALVIALGEMEALIAQRDRKRTPALGQPLQGLSVRWISECDDGEPEVRLAAALASIRSTGDVGPIRANMAGVDPAKPWQWATGQGQRRWFGNSFVERLGGVMAQRVMDAERYSAPKPPLDAYLNLSPYDVLPLLYGTADDAKTEALLWGFTLIDWRTIRTLEGQSLVSKWSAPISKGILPRGWCLLKLLHLPHRVQDRSLPLEPRIVTLLRAGRVPEAVEVASRRLHVSGLVPFPAEGDAWIDPERQLAALLVPVRHTQTLEKLVLEKEPANA